MKDTSQNLLRAAQIKKTPLREKLLEIFHGSHSPLSMPELQRRLERKGLQVNKTSLYRNVELMLRAGILVPAHVSDRSQFYELASREHHHHLICLACERIEDLPVPETALLETVEKASRKLHFEIAEHALEFYGYCGNCHSKMASPAHV